MCVRQLQKRQAQSNLFEIIQEEEPVSNKGMARYKKKVKSHRCPLNVTF